MASELEKVQNELKRVNEAIEKSTPTLRSAKEEFANAKLTGDPSIIAEAKARLDAVFKMRDNLKADRVALLATENILLKQGAQGSGLPQKEIQKPAQAQA